MKKQTADPLEGLENPQKQSPITKIFTGASFVCGLIAVYHLLTGGFKNFIISGIFCIILMYIGYRIQVRISAKEIMRQSIYGIENKKLMEIIQELDDEKLERKRYDFEGDEIQKRYYFVKKMLDAEGRTQALGYYLKKHFDARQFSLTGFSDGSLKLTGIVSDGILNGKKMEEIKEDVKKEILKDYSITVEKNKRIFDEARISRHMDNLAKIFVKLWSRESYFDSPKYKMLKHEILQKIKQLNPLIESYYLVITSRDINQPSEIHKTLAYPARFVKDKNKFPVEVLKNLNEILEKTFIYGILTLFIGEGTFPKAGIRINLKDLYEEWFPMSLISSMHLKEGWGNHADPIFSFFYSQEIEPFLVDAIKLEGEDLKDSKTFFYELYYSGISLTCMQMAFEVEALKKA